MADHPRRLHGERHERTGHHQAATLSTGTYVSVIDPPSTCQSTGGQGNCALASIELGANGSGGSGGAVSVSYPAVSTTGIDGDVANLPMLLGEAGNFSNISLSSSEYSLSSSTNYGGLSLYGIYTAGSAYVSAIATPRYGSNTFNRNFYSMGMNIATRAFSRFFESLKLSIYLFNRIFFTRTGIRFARKRSSGGLGETLLGGRLEAGYTVPLAAKGVSVTPFAAVQPAVLWQGSGTESFASLGQGLTYHATTITALPLYLGAQLDGLWPGGDGRGYAPYLRAAWMHDFGPDRNVPRSFAELPGLNFSGSAFPVVTDAVDVHAGVQFTAATGVSLSAGMDAQFAAAYTSIGATAALRIRW